MGRTKKGLTNKGRTITALAAMETELNLRISSIWKSSLEQILPGEIVPLASKSIPEKVCYTLFF
jgi:hypothetical protein